MTEEEIRRIVREEIAAREQELAAKDIAALDQFDAGMKEVTAPEAGDGPLVRKVKGILRGEDREA